MTPTILTYGPNPDAPQNMRWAAAMVPRTVPAKGKAAAHTEPGTSWLCTGPTEEDARSKLEALWEKQFPAVDRRKGPRPPKPVAEVEPVL